MRSILNNDRNVTSLISPLPPGWMWSDTTTVCSSVRDGTHDTPKYIDEGFPLVTSKNLKGNGIDFSTTRNISNEDYEKIRIRSGVEKDDILLAMIGTIGNPAVVKTEKKFAIKNVALFKKNESVILSQFLCYWLACPLFDKILNSKFIKGTTQKFIPLENLRILPVPLAPINEQKRIVSKLEELFTKLDVGIEYLKNTQILLKQYRQSVLKHAFEGKLTEKWREENELEDKTEIQRDNLSLIPKSWKWVSLNDISQKITDGEHLRPKTTLKGIPFLSAKDIGDKEISFDDVLSVSKYDADIFRKKCNPEKGDILIVSRGATIGRTCLVNTSRVFCLLGSVILIKLLKNVNNKFITYMMKSHHIQKKLTNASGSTAQQAIYLRDIKNILMPLPTIQEQMIISDKLDFLFSVYEYMLHNTEKMLESSRNLRSSILKTAFQGKLVAQDSSDEPAEILLEKIKQEREVNIPIIKEKSKITRRKSISNDSKQMRLM